MRLQSLISHPRVRQAFELLERSDEETVQEQIRIAEIPAPTGEEAGRGAYLLTRFIELGLQAVAADEVGNVIGMRSGFGPPQPPLVIASHLDSIFPAGTEIRVRTRGLRISAPGITDNARGLAASLALIRAMRVSGIETERTICFVGTVGEEGSGDLRGVKHLFRPGSLLRKPLAFLAIDGAGIDRIVHRAIGAHRLRVTVVGPGGHSWGDRGMANPISALGLGIARIRTIRLPRRGNAALTVSRFGGGTSVNAIPSDAWLEVDIRSDDASVLQQLNRETRAAIERAVREEIGVAAIGKPLRHVIEVIGDRPCGSTEPTDGLIRAAVDATRLLGREPELAASSTDANFPISLGVPAIALGAGGLAGETHTLHEWYENQGGVRGLQRALLTILTLAGIKSGENLTP